MRDGLLPRASFLISLIATCGGILISIRSRRGDRFTYLNTALLLPTKLDFAKFAFANGIAQNIFAELCGFPVFQVIMSASLAASALFPMFSCGYNGGRCSSVVVVHGADLMRLRLGQPLFLTLYIDFGLRDEYAVQNFAGFPRRTLGGGSGSGR